MAEPGWELYRSYLAVMRDGSLSGAARRLGLTQPTLGRHIQELEAALGGTALFTRSPQGLTPTETARSLLPHAEAIEAAAAALIRTASAGPDDAAGVVRITASEVMGAEVLPPMLAELRARHPKLVFELVLSNLAQDLLRRDADVAVRMVQPKQDALIARKLGRLRLGMFGRRDYLERCDVPETLDDLASHALIGFDRELVSVRSIEGLQIELTRELFALRTDSDLAQLAALRAGFGLGGCQLGIAQRDPSLVRVLPDALDFHLPVWVVMHEDLRASARVRLVFDHLAERLSQQLAE